MGLEAPLALLGLLAVGLPILAHRVRRRDLPERPFPTLALLKRAEVARRSRASWTDLLLLAARMAVLAAACIAVAAPFVTARLSFGDGRVMSVVIVLDDSMSMQRGDEGSLLELAQRRARSAVASLPEGSQVALVAGGEPARVLLSLTGDLATAERMLQQQPPEALRATDLDAALALAGQQLALADHANRSLLLLSDFAEHARLDESALALAGVDVRVERVGTPPEKANLYFGAVNASDDPTTPGHSSVVVELRSDRSVAAQVQLTAQAGGRELAQTEVEVRDGVGRGLLHVPTPQAGANPTATVEIMNVDALSQDNRMGVLLREPSRLSVLLVNGDPHPASSEDELHYLMRAVNTLASEAMQVHVQAIDAPGLEHRDLTGVDVVVLANVAAPSEAWSGRARRYLESGGGLFVSGGDRVKPAAYNDRLGELLPARLGATGGPADAGLQVVQGAPLALAGPSGLSAVETTRRLLLETDEGVLWRFQDAAPALVVGPVGRGRVALLALSLDAGWSDLPLRPGYLPWTGALLQHLASSSPASVAQASGEPRALSLPPGATRLEVERPDGTRERLAADKAPVFADTTQAGPYRVLAGSAGDQWTEAPRSAFVVTAPSADSSLTPGPVPEVGSDAAPAASGRRLVRRSLSPFIFLLVGTLVLLEALLRLAPRLLRRRV